MRPHRRSDCSFSLEHPQKQQCNRAASERFPFTGGAWHLSSGIAWLVFQIHSSFLNLGLSLIGTACPEYLSSTCLLRFFRELPDTERGSPFSLFWTSFPAHQGIAVVLFSICHLRSKELKQSHYFKFAKLTSKRFKSDFWNTLPVFILDSEGNTILLALSLDLKCYSFHAPEPCSLALFPWSHLLAPSAGKAHTAALRPCR